MKKPSFEDQYPGYPVIPEKRNRFTGPLSLILVLVGLTVVFGGMFYKLSQLHVPTPNMVGANPLSLSTLKSYAKVQAENGKREESAQSYQNYFSLGGTDTDAMIGYAEVLGALGRTDLALQWSNKAVENEPTSKAAIFLRDSLQQKASK